MYVLHFCRVDAPLSKQCTAHQASSRLVLFGYRKASACIVMVPARLQSIISSNVPSYCSGQLTDLRQWHCCHLRGRRRDAAARSSQPSARCNATRREVLAASGLIFSEGLLPSQVISLHGVSCLVTTLSLTACGCTCMRVHNHTGAANRAPRSCRALLG